jgi:hypothetical protein
MCFVAELGVQMTIRATNWLLPLSQQSRGRGHKMASHAISMKQPQEVILGKDVQFIVKRNGRKLGELHVSKGNLEWVPAGSKAKTYRLRWEQVAAMFEDNGRLV